MQVMLLDKSIELSMIPVQEVTNGKFNLLSLLPFACRPRRLLHLPLLRHLVSIRLALLDIQQGTLD